MPLQELTLSDSASLKRNRPSEDKICSPKTASETGMCRACLEAGSVANCEDATLQEANRYAVCFGRHSLSYRSLKSRVAPEKRIQEHFGILHIVHIDPDLSQ